ncbi:hypothetical protein MMC07_009478, partial [Pseudocyphellaria aurata]|nr:hypothetical protein [Pseudocyphellaria aurata]
LTDARAIPALSDDEKTRYTLQATPLILDPPPNDQTVADRNRARADKKKAKKASRQAAKKQAKVKKVEAARARKAALSRVANRSRALLGLSGNDMDVGRQLNLPSPSGHESDDDMGRDKKPDPSSPSGGKSSDGNMDTEEQPQQALGAAGLRPNRKRLCTCDVSVDTLLTEQLDRPPRRTAGEKSDSTRLQFTLALLGGNSINSPDLLCYRHARILTSHWGLQTGALDEKELKRRLSCLWHTQGDLHTLQTSTGTYSWFRQSDRPAMPSDHLGVAKHVPSISQPTGVSDLMVSVILAETTGLDYVSRVWEEDGNLVVTPFTWLFVGVRFRGEYEGGIGELINQEFDMFRHHLARINGQLNRGWLRTMLFGLTQQLIRQDLAYWMLYVALRPNRHYRLVLFPSYCKYVGDGDFNIKFCHIDINISRYLENGRGGNMIQGSVSLDDKTKEDGCTILVKSFHKNLREWWGRVKA